MGVDEFLLSPEVCFALGKGPVMWCTGLWVAWSPKLQLQESERQFLSSLQPAVTNQDYAALMNAKDSGSFFWPAFLVSVEVKFPWNQSVITMQTI